MTGLYFLLICCVASLTDGGSHQGTELKNQDSRRNKREDFDDEKYIKGVRIHGHKCPAARGQFSHESSCKMFYNCWDEVVLLQRCPNGLLFESVKHICDSPDRVNCSGSINPRNPYSYIPIYFKEYFLQGITKFNNIIREEKYDPCNLNDFQIYYFVISSNATMNGFDVKMHGLDKIRYNIVTNQHDSQSETTVDFNMENLLFTANSTSVATDFKTPRVLQISSSIDNVTYRAKFHYSETDGTFLKTSPFNISEIGYMWHETAKWALASSITNNIETALKGMMKDVLTNEFRLLIESILTRSLNTVPAKCPPRGEFACGSDQEVYKNSCVLKIEGLKEKEWPWCLGNHYLCPNFWECPKPGRNAKMICSSDGYFYHNECYMQYNNCGKHVTKVDESNCQGKE